MPISTYYPIANITLTGSASSVTFSGITQQFRDLVLVVTGSMSSDSSINLQINGDTGNNCYGVRTMGNGSSTSSDTYNSSGMAFQQVYVAANTITTWVTNLLDYSATDKHKTALNRVSSASNTVGMEAHRWANTAAVTSIKVNRTVADFTAGSTFALYGVIA